MPYATRRPYRRNYPRRYNRPRKAVRKIVRNVITQQAEKLKHYPFGEDGSTGTISTSCTNTLLTNIPQAGGGARADNFHRSGNQARLTGIYMRGAVSISEQNSSTQSSQNVSVRMVVYQPRFGQGVFSTSFDCVDMIDSAKYKVYHDKIITLASNGPATKYFQIKLNFHKKGSSGKKCLWTPSTAVSSGSPTLGLLYYAIVVDSHASGVSPTLAMNGVSYFTDL